MFEVAPSENLFSEANPIIILLSHVKLCKMSMVTSSSKQKTIFQKIHAKKIRLGAFYGFGFLVEWGLGRAYIQWSMHEFYKSFVKYILYGT
jgi:hypothetical protein